MTRLGLCLGLLVMLVSPGVAADESFLKETREDKEVEIAPAQWITVKQVDVFLDETSPAVKATRNLAALRKALDEESTELTIPWQGRHVRWKGNDIPVSLRVWEDRLYLITFNRGGVSKCGLRYHAQDGDGFKQVKPSDYPKRIATQNLWLKPDRYAIGADGRKIYDVEQAINVNPEDVYFRDTLTAHVWCQLATGKEYLEVSRMANTQPLLREYAKKYNPIKLTAIIRPKTQEEQR